MFSSALCSQEKNANLQAPAERGAHDREAYWIACFVGQLIGVAIVQEREIEQRMDTPVETVDDDRPFCA